MRANSNNPVMSRKQISEKSALFFMVTVCFHSFRVCHSVSLEQREDGLAKIIQDNDVQQENRRLDKLVTDLNTSRERRPQSAAFPEDPLPKSTFQKLGETISDNLSWTIVDNRQPRSSASDSADGYEADFTGVKGQVLGPSFDSNSHVSEWLSMRPSVLCDDNVLTFTASREGFEHLLVDREDASPISPFQLPSYCGYSVKMSWQNLEMMVPYDACYITKENGSYVLPMLWLGSPLKLSCPVQMSTPAPSSSPSVLCSPYGMALQIDGRESDILMMGVIVNGGLVPFLSVECAHLVSSSHGELTFFISYTAPCITIEDGLHLNFIVDDQEYILTCPFSHQFPYVAPPLSFLQPPGEPQFPYIPDPISPETITHPPPLTQEQIEPYAGFQYPQLSQSYPPGPQPAGPPQPTSGSPGPQQQQQQSLYLMGTGNLPYSPGDYPIHLSPHYQPTVVVQAPSFPEPSPEQDSSPKEIFKLPLDSFYYLSDLYNLYGPLYYHAATPTLTPAASKPNTALPLTHPPKPTASPYHPQYYLNIPLYPTAPVTQTPAHPTLSPQQSPTPPLSPPEQTAGPQYPVIPFYSPPIHSSYYYLYPEIPIHFAPSKPSPPAKEKPQNISQEPQDPAHPRVTCLPYSDTICGYYHYPYYPHYHHLYPKPYPAVPQYPTPFTTTTFTTATATPSTTTSTASTPKGPTPQTPHVHCLMGSMIAFLPFAHPGSIQVKDLGWKTWMFLSSISSVCGYKVQIANNSGVILHSPLPACHSESQTPTSISLPLRFWDLSMSQYRTFDLQCPHQTTPEYPAPVTPTVSPTSRSSTKVTLPVIPKPKVTCYSHQMTVELPAGPISGVFVKDVKGNQMNLQDVPMDCGYSARKGKDGKIYLRLQLHLRCHVSVQGKLYNITIVYTTESGRQEAQFFCPVLIPGSEKECNLPSEQHLPCGPGSVSQPQCLSMGCCYSKHPPSCYYPLDACTIDRHMVFSVPASLTDPPLSPSLLLTLGNTTCKPERVTSEYALFKIPMDGCGARRVMVGKTMVHMVEVINKVHAINLNYGTITRDAPVRLLVECRYLPSNVLTVNYMVKTPSLGPAIHTQGVFGVQLRIAKDAQYSSYYPQYHQPLEMLLGKLLYLEVRLLNNPDPTLVLLVHFCVAYPRSGNAVWLLVYNGCTNPLDPVPQQGVLMDPRPPSPLGQTRRFAIRTFLFLSGGEVKNLDEEIYFMCSTEICSPSEGLCVEGCFGQ